MSSLLSAAQLLPSGFTVKDVLPYSLAVVTGLLGWLSRRSTESAQLQKTLLDASREWVEQQQQMLAHRDARIIELEYQLADSRKTCLEHLGGLRNAEQARDSVITLARNAGVELPTEVKKHE